MPIAEKIRAGVERMIVGETVGANPPQPVMKVLGVKVITQNIEFARKIEPEIAALLEKRDKAIAKAQSNKTIHPEVVKQQVKDLEARTSTEMDALLAKLGENAGLLAAQREHYSHDRCLQRAEFADPATRSAVILRLQRVSPVALVDAAREALASADAASMGCVKDEIDARIDLQQSDPRSLSREARTDLNLLIASIPSDAMKVSALLNEYDLITRRARIASGRATKSVDKIAAGLRARELGATK